MARNIGVDYGASRVGLAVTDPLNIVATGLATLSPREALAFIIEYCATHDVDKIVIGKPTHIDGKPTQIFEQIITFSDKLIEKIENVEVCFHEEYGTSKLARQIMLKAKVPKKKRREKGRVDQLSARLILSDYLGIVRYSETL